MVAKDSKKKSPPDHPPYAVMVQTAIKELKNRKGSSKQAILKYIKASYKVKGDPNVHAKVALLKLLKDAKVERSSGAGLSGRFKLKPGALEKKKPKKKSLKAKKSPKKAAKKTVAKPKQSSKKSVKKSPKKSPKKSSKKPKSPKKSTKKSPQKKQTAKQSTMKKQRKSTTKKAKKPAPQKKRAKK